MALIPYPFVRITLLFIAGILLSIQFPSFLPDHSLQFSLLFIVLLYFPVQYTLGRSYYLKYVSGALGLAFIFLAGVLTVSIRTESNNPNHIIHIREKIDAFQVVRTPKGVLNQKVKQNNK